MVKRNRDEKQAEISGEKLLNSSDVVNDGELTQPFYSPELSRISSSFNVLDTILLSFKTRNIISKWSDVQVACASINSTAVTLAEVCNILRIFPTAYKLTWQQAGQFSTSASKHESFELVISLNLPETLGHVSSEVSKRAKLFSTLAVGALAQDPNCLDEPDYNLIPEKPEVVKHKPMIKKTSSLTTSSSSTESDLPSANNDDHASANSESNSLEALRLKIVEREQSLKIKAQVVQADNNERDRVKQLQFLLVVSDALRAMLKSENRSCQSLVDAAQKLVLTTKCKTREAKVAILSLSEVVPEFVTVLPPDDVLNYVSIRVNADCVYSDVRTRLLSYIRENTKKK